VFALVAAAAAFSAIGNGMRRDPLPMRLPEALYQVESEARPILLPRAVRLYKEGRSVFLDARSPDEFAFGQIDGALSVPIERWQDLYPEILPWIEGQKMVVYAGAADIGPADDLAGALLTRGQPPDSIFLYVGGMEEWLRAGLPIRKGGGDFPAPDEEPVPLTKPEVEPEP
jgi:rhodanese-related sulfurtransferase